MSHFFHSSVSSHSSVSQATVSASTLAGMRLVIDARLRLLLPLPHDADDRVGIAMHEGVLAPGKRIRPLLMLLVGRGVGSETKALIDLACAVEMVHAASLLVDDLPCMDNAWMRRGRPAIHARFGQDVAMLAAVALLSQACATVASTPDLPGTLRAQLVQLLCEAVGARGPFRDLHKGRSARPASSIASSNDQKTGVLFAAALDIAALAAGAPDEARHALRAAASELGQAFHLQGDLEDACDELMDRLKDSRQDDGKSTLVAVLGRDAVKRRLDAHLLQASAHLQGAFPGNEGLIGLMLEAFGVLRQESEAPEPSVTPARYARAAGQAVALGVVR